MAFLRISNRGVGAGVGPFALYSGASSGRRAGPTKTQFRDSILTNLRHLLAYTTATGKPVPWVKGMSHSQDAKMNRALGSEEFGEAARIWLNAYTRTFGDSKENLAYIHAQVMGWVNGVRQVTAKTAKAAEKAAKLEKRRVRVLARQAKRDAKATAEYEMKRRVVEPGIPQTTSPAPEGAPNAEVKIEYLRFRALHRDGLLSDQEFEAKRQELADRLR